MLILSLEKKMDFRRELPALRWGWIIIKMDASTQLFFSSEF